MDEDTYRPTRRTVLRNTAGTAVTALALGAAGRARAQEERPDFDGWLDGVDGGYLDARGQSEVTVLVGADGNTGSFAFDPAGLWVDPGTTVTWEWTGDGGGHNVNAQSGADFGTDIIAEAGFTFSYTFEESGITTYQCDPHATLGMKGAVAVGDVATTTVGGTQDGGISLPGGEAGAAVVLSMLGITGLAVLAALSGEFSDLLDGRTEGPSSAYRLAAGAIAVGMLLVVIVTVRLLVGG